MRTEIEIPCQWNKAVLEKIVTENQREGGSSKPVINAIYGSLSKGILGNGRAPETVVDVEDYVNYREYAKSQGINFYYTLNAPHLPKYIRKNRVEIKSDLHWIADELQPDALIMSSRSLMRVVRSTLGEIPIHISSIARVSKAKDIGKYLDFGPEKITVQHDVGRNFKDLEEINRRGKELGIDIVVMLTESCLRRCPDMRAHYNHVGHGGSDKDFHFGCNSQKVLYPRELLKANVIRPEDIGFYEGIGISSFKITGRSKEAKWLPLVAKVYLERSFKGNLIRLLGIDPNLNAEDWIYINNEALDGFIEGFPQTGNVEDENAYCEGWAVKLFRQGDLHIDGFDYKIENNKLVYKGGLPNLYRIYGVDEK